MRPVVFAIISVVMITFGGVASAQPWKSVEPSSVGWSAAAADLALAYQQIEPIGQSQLQTDIDYAYFTADYCESNPGSTCKRDGGLIYFGGQTLLEATYGALGTGGNGGTASGVGGEVTKYRSVTASDGIVVLAPEGYRPLSGVGAIGNDVGGLPSGFARIVDTDGNIVIADRRGNIYNSVDSLPVPTGSFSGKYEANPKHDAVRPGVSPQPTNAEQALSNSVPLGGNSTGRIAYDSSTGEIVVFQNHSGDIYHGYVPSSWNELRQSEKNALIRAGLFTPKGRPIK